MGMLNYFSRRKERRLIKGLQELEKAAAKVLCYRRDVLPVTIVTAIEGARQALIMAINGHKKGEDTVLLERKAEALETLLKTNGGKVYPASFLSENVEMIVVAAILAIGFRTFFFQPFKIPTNSMYPSYYGMTEEIYTKAADAPNPFMRAIRWVLLGATHFEVLAASTGELVLSLNPPGPSKKSGLLNYNVTPGRGLLGLIPESVREYTFWVNGKSSTLQVPFEYNLDDVLLQRYFPGETTYEDLLEQATKVGKIRPGRDGYMWFTGIQLKANEPILDFDILSGDRLFVDRFTFNFRAPRVGDTIVFYTRQIKGLNQPDGTPDDRFYIKRCVGLPRDVLEIRPPVLYRNGAPITGSVAFDLNANREGLYPGYVNRWDLAAGKTVTVPKGGYYCLGDNSPGSLDSRFWGVAPEKEVVGRAAFIYYPFTARWGLAK